MELNKGDSDYTTLDNAEMLAGIPAFYEERATAFDDSTNVFVTYYRQSSLRYAWEVWKKTGNIDATMSGIPYYYDITAFFNVKF